MPRKVGLDRHDLDVAQAVAGGEDPPPRPEPERKPRKPRAVAELSPEAEEILEGLTATVTQLDEARALVDSIHEHRVALYTAGRALDPPLSMTLMGKTCGVSEVAVIKAIRKAGAGS